jgi:hypothetical protein
MMHDQDDKDAIRHNLQRWRDMLKRDIDDDDARRALHELINGAEKRLAAIEGRPEKD